MCYERYWTQIAERFKGYSDHLIFEGANEELGDRLNDANRHLLIPGYNTNIDATVDDRFKMPADTAKDKLFLSAHFYDPTNLCLDGGGGDYTTEDQARNKASFAKLQKFADAGYGIIIGECSVCNPSATTSSVTQWLSDTFTYAQGVPLHFRII